MQNGSNPSPDLPDLTGKVIPIPLSDTASSKAPTKPLNEQQKVHAEEDAYLVAQWRAALAGDEVAMNNFLASLSPLFRNPANRYSDWLRIDAEDWVQEALVAVWKKLLQFDPGKGKFKTWAYQVGRNAMLNNLDLRSRISRHHYDNWKKVMEATDDLMRELNRKPTNAEIAARTGLPKKSVENALNHMALAFTVSLDQMLEERSGDDSSSDHCPIPDALKVFPKEANSDEIKIRLLETAMVSLEERDRKVVILFCYEGMTHGEIATRLGISEANSKKILSRAIEKLRRLLEGKL